MCGNYFGAACADGSCPMSHMDEYQKRGYPVVRNCVECDFYKGCKDCFFEYTSFCDEHDGSR